LALRKALVLVVPNTPPTIAPTSAPLRPLELDAAAEVCVCVCVWSGEAVEVVDIVVTRLIIDVD